MSQTPNAERARALAEELRKRANDLTGESWEWRACRDLMNEAADLLAALPPAPQTEPKAGELRNIVAHPFYVMALQFGWPDEQVKAARDLVEITIIRLEEWASALPPVRAEQETEQGRDARLDCRIIGGRLVIDIGIDTLAFATKESPTLYQRYGYDKEKGEERKNFVTINDADVWAKEVLLQIVAESEDGSSLMTKLFDDAIERAIDDGAEGIDIPEIGLVDHDDE